jgi:hypothetical protein
MEKKDIRKMFPHLYEELQSPEAKVPIDGIRKNAAAAEEELEDSGCDEITEPPDISVQYTMTPDKLRHFNPQAIDFLRRCDTEVQAEEIITYLEKKKEISTEYATELRCQMQKKGVRSFGPKKEDNHYFREGGIY